MNEKQMLSEENSPKPAENTHKGHRQRMRERYEHQGLDNFQPHEVLEMLMFRSIVQGNTNPTAHALLDVCGSMEAVLEGNTAVHGVGEKTLAMLRETGGSLENILQEVLRMAEQIGQPQFYMTAVWMLRRKPAGVFVMVCQGGRFSEMVTVEDVSPEKVFRALPAKMEEDEVCHIAFMGRVEEARLLRKLVKKKHIGLLLSLSYDGVPQWV